MMLNIEENYLEYIKSFINKSNLNFKTTINKLYEIRENLEDEYNGISSIEAQLMIESFEYLLSNRKKLISSIFLKDIDNYWNNFSESIKNKDLTKLDKDINILCYIFKSYTFEKILKHKFELPIKDKREYNIHKERVNGKTLEEIGEEYNLTRERVRQICDKHKFKFTVITLRHYQFDFYFMDELTVDEKILFSNSTTFEKVSKTLFIRADKLSLIKHQFDKKIKDKKISSKHMTELEKVYMDNVIGWKLHDGYYYKNLSLNNLIIHIMEKHNKPFLINNSDVWDEICIAAKLHGPTVTREKYLEVKVKNMTTNKKGFRVYIQEGDDNEGLILEEYNALKDTLIKKGYIYLKAHEFKSIKRSIYKKLKKEVGYLGGSHLALSFYDEKRYKNESNVLDEIFGSELITEGIFESLTGAGIGTINNFVKKNHLLNIPNSSSWITNEALKSVDIEKVSNIYQEVDRESYYWMRRLEENKIESTYIKYNTRKGYKIKNNCIIKDTNKDIFEILSIKLKDREFIRKDLISSLPELPLRTIDTFITKHCSNVGLRADPGNAKIYKTILKTK